MSDWVLRIRLTSRHDGFAGEVIDVTPAVTVLLIALEGAPAGNGQIVLAVEDDTLLEAD